MPSIDHCWVGAACQAVVRNAPAKWYEFWIHLRAVDCPSPAVPPPCLLLSRRVAGREEGVLALSGVLQTCSAAVMLPAVSPCRRERGRGVNFVSANAFAVGGRVQALATACWSYLVQTDSAELCRECSKSAVLPSCFLLSRRVAGSREEVLELSVPIRSLWSGECKLVLLLAGLTWSNRQCCRRAPCSRALPGEGKRC